MRVLTSWSATLALAAIGATSTPQLPDVSKGQINGRIAMIAMPVSGVDKTSGGARFDTLLSPEDCETHLTPVENLESELTYPCGKWFQPPEGNYRIWLEKPALISEGYGLLRWENEPFSGKGMSMVMGMEPAGKVALASPMKNDQSFRIVHLRAVHKGTLRPAFDRRVNAEVARRGIPVATGSVLAGIFDRKTDEAVALATPIEVKAGITSRVAPTPPAKGTDLLVVLGRPRPGVLGKHLVDVGLRVNRDVRKPDVLLASASNVFAVWYGVEGTEATLLAESSTLQLDPTKVQLKPGKVVTIRTKLTTRPSIAVSIGGPEDALRTSTMQLELRSDPDGDLLQQKDAAVNTEVRFDALISRAYDVVLRVDEWEFRQSVTLTDEDEQVVFTLSPIFISGVVYHGRDPAPHADVGFLVGQKWMRTNADDHGRYETVFWRAGEYVAEIKIRDEQPFWEAGFDIRASRTIDFHVPNTRFAVDVRDVQTGEPIIGAKVMAGSVYEGANGEGRVVQTAISGNDGRALLPPMRSGEMTIRARAEGYFDSDVTRHVITRTDQQGQFEIRLRPVGDTIPVTIRNPDGSPAAGAIVWAVRSTGGLDAPLWTGTADQQGLTAIPRAVRSAYFLVRARDAGAAVRRLIDDTNVVWLLSPSAPLTLHAGARTRVAVWIDDVRVSGGPLTLLTGSVDGTDEAGDWFAAMLPQQPLRILAWRTAPAAAVESGAYDLAATQVGYPWPRIVDLQPVD